MTTHTRLLAALTAGVLTLGLTACGGTTSSSPTTESPVAATSSTLGFPAPESSSGEISLGVPLQMQGTRGNEISLTVEDVVLGGDCTLGRIGNAADVEGFIPIQILAEQTTQAGAVNGQSPVPPLQVLTADGKTVELASGTCKWDMPGRTYWPTAMVREGETVPLINVGLVPDNTSAVLIGGHDLVITEDMRVD